MSIKFFVPALLFVMIAFAPLMYSCKNDPIPVNDQEIITRLTLYFQEKNLSGNSIGSPAHYSWIDEDGDGGNDPIVDSILLKPLTTYGVTLEVLNESISPAVDITEEVLTEGTDHQFFFITEATANITFQYTDKDENQQPIGITATVQTGIESHGKLKVVLRHLPDKSAMGVSDGDITNAGGETDFESVPSFDLIIMP